MSNQDNYDEFMKASAEEWSKPETPAPVPARAETPTNRWGAPVAQPNADDGSRWGAPKLDPSDEPKLSDLLPSQKGKNKWWIIALIAGVLVCLCACLVIIVLLVLGVLTLTPPI